MSKKMEERTLAEAVASTSTINKRRTRPANVGTTGKTNSKKTRKRTGQTKSVSRRKSAKSNAVAKSVPAEDVITADERIPAECIPMVEAQPQEREEIQEVNAPADVEILPHQDALMSHELGCEPQVAASDGLREEEKMPAPVTEIEIITDAVQIQTSTELRSGTILRWLINAWTWALKQLRSRQARKRLRVCETVSLGEKRFVAVIEVDGEQFLVGGASSSVSTLARLVPSEEFADALRQRWAEEPVQA